MSLTCRFFTPADAAAWSQFVQRHPDGTFFHLPGWQQVIADSFGHRPYYILCERSGQITGILPLIHMKTMLFGNALISLPFCVYAGPIADDAQSLSALLDYAAAFMDQKRIPYCELRGPVHPDLDLAQAATWHSVPPLYATFRKSLAATAEEALKAIPRKQRAVVRKAIDRGLSASITTNIEPFFGLYAESMRNLGTPMFPRRYFRNLQNIFTDSVEILTIYDGETPLCAVLSFVHKGQILPYYAGGGIAARGAGGHDFMYWEVMRRAIGQGLTSFDFGRSKIDTGAYAFKKNWGFEPEPLHYTMRLRAGETAPEHNPLNPKYQLMIKLWKRLPIPVANFIGPHIMRGLG
jgi:FemAB-related protein (PEP-CTERM system-associated)